MSFLTNLQMQGAIGDALKLDPASTQAVPSHVTDIAAAANVRAYREIVRRLTAIGYSQGCTGL